MNLISFFSKKDKQLEKAILDTNQIYNGLNLYELNNSEKMVKLSLFIDSIRRQGIDIDFNAIFTLLGSKIKKEAAVINNYKPKNFEELLK